MKQEEKIRVIVDVNILLSSFLKYLRSGDTLTNYRLNHLSRNQGRMQP